MVFNNEGTSQKGYMTFNQADATMREKAWYGYNPTTQGFDWHMSVANIAQGFGLKHDIADDCITRAYTPACLSQVTQVDGKEVEPKPLLQMLKDLGIQSSIWTMGDFTWQHTKYEKCGANAYIPEERFHCYEKDKLNKLVELINMKADGEKKRVIIVDDKENTNKDLKNIKQWYNDTQSASKGIVLEEYWMELKNELRDANAFYKWIIEQKAEAEKAGQKLELILDFDGVIADTDSVLFGPALNNLLIEHNKPYVM